MPVGNNRSRLTPKQKRFVTEYLIDLNATQAAIRAGYSKRTAGPAGARLLMNVIIAGAIQKAKDSRAGRTEVNADWVLKRLVDEAEADIADLYDEHNVLLPVREWPLIWRQGLASGLDVDEQFSEGVKTGQLTKIKLSDRIKRIEMIGKHIGVQAFSERQELSGIGGVPLQIEVSFVNPGKRNAKSKT